MIPYADTNFFTRWYLDLPDSARVIALAESAQQSGATLLPVSWLHRAELCNALQIHVFLGRKPGHCHVTAEQAGIAMATFRAELTGGGLLRAVTLPVADLEAQAEELSLRHTARHGFGTYDLLHVSSALLLGCDTFWSFDAKASKLAKLEGLRGIL